MVPETILYIAMSQDGFIAGEDGDLSFLEPMHLPGEDYGYSAFLQTVGSIVVGRKTYQTVLDMGVPYHPDLPVHILTRQPLGALDGEALNPRHSYRHGPLPDLIQHLKTQYNGNIYCDGGAELAHSLLHAHLIDRIILSVVPSTLNAGVPLFPQGHIPVSFSCIRRHTFPSGLVQLELHR